jgi:hypothetical protein
MEETSCGSQAPTRVVAQLMMMMKHASRVGATFFPNVRTDVSCLPCAIRVPTNTRLSEHLINIFGKQ